MLGYEDKSRDYFHAMRPDVEKYVPAGTKTVLDVGCARGFFAARVRASHQAETWGIELMAEPAREAEALLDKVLVGDAVALLPQIPDGYFDCITMNDVLEHVVDPWSLLSAIKSKLSPRGVVVASIPNVRYFTNLYDLLIRSDWEYREEGVLDKTHLRFFTRKSMLRLFQRAGYEVMSIEGTQQTPSWKAQILVLLTFGRAADMRFLQFVIVARPDGDAPRV